MSAVTDPIAEANDRVRLSALNKLARRLDEETDPIRLEKLLTIALRIERTRPKSPSPGSAGEGGRGSARPDEGVAETSVQTLPRAHRNSCQNAASTPISAASRTNTPAPASTDDLTYDDLPQGPAIPLPTYLPMTDDEFVKLAKEIGLTEAHRQRIIRASLVETQHERAANSS